MSVCPQVLGGGRFQQEVLSHRLGLVLHPGSSQGLLWTRPAHHHHPGEIGPGASQRGSEGVGLRGRSLVVSRAGTRRLSPGDGRQEAHTGPGWGGGSEGLFWSLQWERVFLREGVY